MGSIRVLSPEVVNQIAAGEVVERPASVVKELIENALDAHATCVRVDIEDGGKKSIRVLDDGDGIEPSDLAVLFTSHATSKIQSAEDLSRVRSLGFRGEALASVGSVAHVIVSSRRRGSLEGFRVRCQSGQTAAAEPVGAAEGTIVEVRHLFQNVPARRKFLKADALEYEHIRETVTRMGLAYPSIRFELYRDGQPDRILARAEGARERIAALFEKSFADELIDLRTEGPVLALDAYLGPPKFSRTTMQGQYLFLNGRCIRDRLLTRAINDAYREVLVSGRYAVAFLFVTIPSDQVDVNVHPSKAEVRFRESGRVYDQVTRAIRERLVQGVLTPTVRPEEFVPEAREAIAEFFARPIEAPTLVAALAKPVVETKHRCFQLHRKYIVEEVGDGIQIIDQHALHERVMLERLKAQFASSNLARQRLLIPATVEVTETERDVLEKNRRALESVGVEIGDFGRRTIQVRSLPALLQNVPPERLVRDFLDLATEGGTAEIVHLEHLLEFLACKSAVRFGDELSREQIEELLSQRHHLENPHSCAHGRPVAIKLSLQELEKFFRRR